MLYSVCVLLGTRNYNGFTLVENLTYICFDSCRLLLYSTPRVNQIIIIILVIVFIIIYSIIITIIITILILIDK